MIPNLPYMYDKRSPMFTRLLAKSLKGEKFNTIEAGSESIFLPNHLQDVAASNQAIFLTTGLQMLRAVGLNESWLERLQNVSALAAWLHDLGKANSDFQNAIRAARNDGYRQQIRHEWISVWIASQTAMKAWLLLAVDSCELSWQIAMYAIGGHHPKLNRSAPTIECFRSEPILIPVSHADFQQCLEQIRDHFNLADDMPDIFPTVYQGAGDRKAKNAFRDFMDEYENLWESEIRFDPDWIKFCAIVKATLISADVAGSALWEKIKTPEQRQEWIYQTLGRHPNSEELQKIVAARLGDYEPHDFQLKIGDSSSSVTLVEAGCGSGKTLAAYMWAANQHPGKRLWFCYPTTGTASEGYKGYLHQQFPANSGVRTDLFHSRSEFDKTLMLDTTGSSDDDDLDDSVIRIDSLRAWDTQIVACTVDSVLLILQNQRRGHYAWPALANAAIVFDEVHCYDEVLFGNLLTWLENLVGIPVLLMTASLPQGRRNAIEAAIQKSNRSLTHIPAGPDELETLPRYKMVDPGQVRQVVDAISLVEEELKRGGRVLWISNIVERTKKVAELITSVQPAIYHSRFIYKDRIDRHNDVIGLFDSTQKTGLASTSQVAEMSLDLAYATLLITELAPIPAMIQRFGRLARRIDNLADFEPGTFLVVEPLKDGEPSPRPYDKEELELARKWLASLPHKPLSQRDLIAAWQELEDTVPVRAAQSNWLTGGPITSVDSIRESGYGITVIRREDLERAKAEGVTQYTLPMERPKKQNWQETWPFRGYPVASQGTIGYNPDLGGEWTTHFEF